MAGMTLMAVSVAGQAPTAARGKSTAAKAARTPEEFDYVANKLLGELKLEYAATPTYFWDIAVDDNAFLALRNEAGQMAWLHASWTEWKNLFSFELFGRVGKLEVSGLGGSYGVEKLTFYRMLPQMGPPETTVWEYPQPDESWAAEFAELQFFDLLGRAPLERLGSGERPLKTFGEELQSIH